MANVNVVGIKSCHIWMLWFLQSSVSCVFFIIVESTPSYSGIDDEDIEEEFKKLELELKSENPEVTMPGASEEARETGASESAESLSFAFSSLGLEDGPARASATRDSEVPVRSNESKYPVLEAA